MPTLPRNQDDSSYTELVKTLFSIHKSHITFFHAATGKEEERVRVVNQRKVDLSLQQYQIACRRVRPLLFAEFNLNCSTGTNDTVDTIKKKAEACTSGFCLGGGYAL